MIDRDDFTTTVEAAAAHARDFIEPEWDREPTVADFRDEPMTDLLAKDRARRGDDG